MDDWFKEAGEFVNYLVDLAQGFLVAIYPCVQFTSASRDCIPYADKLRTGHR